MRLTAEQRAERDAKIKQAVADGVEREDIAARFGVHRETITNILTGKRAVTRAKRRAKR